MQNLIIRLLEPGDVQQLAEAFVLLGWDKPASQYVGYLREQACGLREVWVAFCENTFAGYVTICWHSNYAPFAEAHIAEIVDLNVLPAFRRRGIGTRLMQMAEERAVMVSPVVGIGVGMTADYGSAQRLYVRRGYLPDGRGLISAGRPVVYGNMVTVDDALCLYFTKKLFGSM